MASTTNLRSRRSPAQLHALAGVEREIRAQDTHSRRKYLREFNRAFRSYDAVLDSQQVQAAIHSADVVLVGDYHALPAAQRYAATLLEQRALAGDRPVVLGVLLAPLRGDGQHTAVGTDLDAVRVRARQVELQHDVAVAPDYIHRKGRTTGSAAVSPAKGPLNDPIEVRNERVK